MPTRNTTFWSSGSLRIMDAPDLHDEITTILGNGSTCHKRGDNFPGKPSRKQSKDIWLLDSPIPEKSQIQDHLHWLCNLIEPHEEQLRNWTARGANIDFYFSYACDDDHRGFGLPPESLAVFSRIGMRLEVSILT